MINAVHQLLLSRLDATPAPTVRLRELLAHPESSWRPLLANGVLTEADTPDEIEFTPARFLHVRMDGTSYFGFDTAEDYPTPQPLSREDITEYRVVIPALLTHLRDLNAIDGRKPSALPDLSGLHFLGRKSMSGGVASVWIAIALGPPDAAAGRLATLSQEDAHAQHVVIFPIWPDLPAATVSALVSRGVFIADLDNQSFSIHWPRELTAHVTPTVPNYGLIFEGASWRLHFLGDEFTIPNRIGSVLLARLLNDPTNSWTPLELERGHRTTTLHRPPPRSEDGTEISETMEAPLYAASNSDVERLRRKTTPLRRQLAEAERTGDTASESEARAALAKLLPGETQISGRDHRPRVSGAAEKARKNVSKHINAILDIIDDLRPTVGKHIRDHLTLGYAMTYSPAHGELWQVIFQKSSPLPRK